MPPFNSKLLRIILLQILITLTQGQDLPVGPTEHGFHFLVKNEEGTEEKLGLFPDMPIFPSVPSDVTGFCVKGLVMTYTGENYGEDGIMEKGHSLRSDYDTKWKCWRDGESLGYLNKLKSLRYLGNLDYAVPSLQIYKRRSCIGHPIVNISDTRAPERPQPILLDSPTLGSIVLTGTGYIYFISKDSDFSKASSILCLDTRNVVGVGNNRRFVMEDVATFPDDWPVKIKAVTWKTQGYPDELSLEEQEKLNCYSIEDPLAPPYVEPTTTTAYDTTGQRSTESTGETASTSEGVGSTFVSSQSTDHDSTTRGHESTDTSPSHDSTTGGHESTDTSPGHDSTTEGRESTKTSPGSTTAGQESTEMPPGSTTEDSTERTPGSSTEGLESTDFPPESTTKGQESTEPPMDWPTTHGFRFMLRNGEMLELFPDQPIFPSIPIGVIGFCIKGLLMGYTEENFGSDDVMARGCWMRSNYESTWQCWRDPTAVEFLHALKSLRYLGSYDFSIPSIQIFKRRRCIGEPFLNMSNINDAPSTAPILLDPIPTFGSLIISGTGYRYFISKDDVFTKASSILCIDTRDMVGVGSDRRFVVPDVALVKHGWPVKIKAVTWSANGFPQDLPLEEQGKLTCFKPQDPLAPIYEGPTTTTWIPETTEGQGSTDMTSESTTGEQESTEFPQDSTSQHQDSTEMPESTTGGQESTDGPPDSTTESQGSTDNQESTDMPPESTTEGQGSTDNPPDSTTGIQGSTDSPPDSTTEGQGSTTEDQESTDGSTEETSEGHESTEATTDKTSEGQESTEATTEIQKSTEETTKGQESTDWSTEATTEEEESTESTTEGQMSTSKPTTSTRITSSSTTTRRPISTEVTTTTRRPISTEVTTTTRRPISTEVTTTTRRPISTEVTTTTEPQDPVTDSTESESTQRNSSPTNKSKFMPLFSSIFILISVKILF